MMPENLFQGYELPLGIPRQSAADAIMSLFQAGEWHVHLHAPPGFGKQSVIATLLQDWTGPTGTACHVDLSNLVPIVENPVAQIAVCLQLLGVARPDLAVDQTESDWAKEAVWPAIIEDLKGRSFDGQKPLLIISSAEMLLEVQAIEIETNGLKDCCRLLTVSIAPYALVCNAAEGLASIPSVSLPPFPAPEKEQDDYLAEFSTTGDTPERVSPDDAQNFARDGQTWFQKFVAELPPEQQMLKGEIFKLFRPKHLLRKDEQLEGHPLVDFALCDTMLRAALNGLDVRSAKAVFTEALNTALSVAGTEYDNDEFAVGLRARLVPNPLPDNASSSPNRWQSPVLLDGIGRALSHLLDSGKQSASDKALDWAVASGLVRRIGATGWAWTEVTRLIERSPGHGIRTLAQNLVERAIVLREKARQHETSHDPRLRAIVDHVKETLCDSPEGIERDRKVVWDPDLTRPLIEKQVYRVVLSESAVQSESDTAPPKSKSKSKSKSAKRAPLRPNSEILVFDGIASDDSSVDSRKFLRRQIRNLSLLGRLQHPALPAFGQGGVLEPSDMHPERCLFIEIKNSAVPMEPERILAHFHARLADLGPMALLADLALLADGLARMHGMGIIHRSFDFSCLRLGYDDRTVNQDRLTISGFEHATLLHAILREGNPELQVGRAYGLIDLACRSPGIAVSEGTYDPGVDTYAFAAMATLALTGSVQGETRKAVNDLRAEAVRKDTLTSHLVSVKEILREDLCRDDRWSPLDMKPALKTELKNLLQGILREDEIAAAGKSQEGKLSDKTSMATLAASLSYIERKLVKSQTLSDKKWLVAYEPISMATMLNKINRNMKDRDPSKSRDHDVNTPDGLARLTDALQRWVDNACWLHFSRGGFPKSGDVEAVNRRRQAKYMLVGGDLAIYASLRREGVGERETTSTKALFLNYVLQTARLLIPKHVDLAQDSQVQGVDDRKTWVDLDGTIEVVPAADLDRRLAKGGFEDWKERTDLVENRATAGDPGGKIEDALTVWRCHRDYLRAIDEMKRFPVTVKWENMQRRVLDVEIDTNAFNRYEQLSQFYFFRRSILRGVDRRQFFEDTVKAEWDQQNGSGGRINLDFFSGRNRVSVAIKTLERTDRGRFKITYDGQPPDFQEHITAHLTMSSFFGSQTMIDRQDEAIERLARDSRLMKILVDPYDCGRYLMPGTGEGMTGDFSSPEGMKLFHDRIAIMMASDPLHVVQGPPGTGKTTLEAHMISEALRWNDGSRILVTSQSHAATDNILDAVVRRLSDNASLNSTVAPGTVIRTFPEERSSKVDSKIESRFSVDAQTKELLRARGERARQRSDNQKVQIALEKLKSVGYFELRSRVERSAPVVFSTTGSAPLTLPYLSSDRMPSYDMTVIDEAAKAWSLDLVMPMSISARVIAVGDPMQLSPFGEIDFIKFLRNAYEIRNEEGAPPDLARLLADDLDAHDNGFERKLNEMLGWLKIFHRILERKPPRASQDLTGIIPVSQILDTQYRSVATIGNIVSTTFYKGTVRNGGPEPAADKRLPIPVDGTEAPRPAMVWIDTSTMRNRAFVEDSHGRGHFVNNGEIKVIMALIAGFQPGDEPPWERLKIMSPYASQVNAIARHFEGHPEQLGVYAEEIPKLVMTADSSQGSESDIVIVSLCRSDPDKRNELENVLTELQSKSEIARDSRLKLERMIRSTVGFLTAAERINVILSRAKQQLILIGDQAQFRVMSKALQCLEPPKTKDAPSQMHFWQVILDSLEQSGPVGTIPHDPETPFIIGVHRLIGV